MKREHLIRRYEHNYFRGWVVSTKRRGKRFTRYFSNHPRAPRRAVCIAFKLEAPYWTGKDAKQSAIDYAKARAKFGR